MSNYILRVHYGLDHDHIEYVEMTHGNPLRVVLTKDPAEATYRSLVEAKEWAKDILKNCVGAGTWKIEVVPTEDIQNITTPPSQDEPTQCDCCERKTKTTLKGFCDYCGYLKAPPTPNGVVSKNPIIAHPTTEKEPVMSSDELDLERELMGLKSEDGMYVLTSLTTPATLSTLVNFITQQTTAARIDEHNHIMWRPDEAKFIENQADRLSELKKGL